MVEVFIWVVISYGCQIWLLWLWKKRSWIGFLKKRYISEEEDQKCCYTTENGCFCVCEHINMKIHIRTIRYHQVLLIPHERSRILFTEGVHWKKNYVFVYTPTWKYVQQNIINPNQNQNHHIFWPMVHSHRKPSKVGPQGTFIKKHLNFQCSHVHNVKRDSCDVPFHRKKRMREMSCTVHGTTDDRLNIMLWNWILSQSNRFNAFFGALCRSNNCRPLP